MAGDMRAGLRLKVSPDVISVIIPTHNSERALIPVLCALVPGATSGILREVILVDAGSHDDTAAIADAAGCVFIPAVPDLGQRLRQGARAAHAPWLMFLQPDCLLDQSWPQDVAQFLAASDRRAAPDKMAATFRFAADGEGLRARLDEAIAALALSLFGAARAGQGLLISRTHYERIKGHRPGARHELHLANRLDRCHVRALRTRAVRMGTTEP